MLYVYLSLPVSNVGGKGGQDQGTAPSDSLRPQSPGGPSLRLGRDTYRPTHLLFFLLQVPTGCPMALLDAHTVSAATQGWQSSSGE